MSYPADGRLSLADETTVENVLADARFGEMLGIAGDMCFLRNDLFNTAAAGQARVHAQRAVSGARVQIGLSTTTIGGFPVAVDASGVTADNFDEVRPSLILDSGTLRQITEAVQTGRAFVLDDVRSPGPVVDRGRALRDSHCRSRWCCSSSRCTSSSAQHSSSASASPRRHER